MKHGRLENGARQRQRALVSGFRELTSGVTGVRGHGGEGSRG